MGTPVSIDSIQNNHLKSWALCVDAMGVGENDKYLDTQEWNTFLKGAVEDVQNKKCTQEDFDQVLGLYLSEPQSANLPPKQKGLIDNLKSYFCDENGDFSALETGKSLFTAGAAVLLVFAGFRAFGALSQMVKKGGSLKKLICKKPKVLPKNNASVPTNVPTAQSTQLINKPIQSTNASATAVNPTNVATGASKTQTATTVTKNAKNVETVAIKGGQKRITKDAHGRVSKVEILKGGKVTRQIRTDINGKKITTDYVYRADGGVDKTIIKYEKGAVDIARNGDNLSYPNGAIKEIKYENWQYTEITKNLKGEHLETNIYDTHNRLVKQIFAKPDSKNRIMIERDWEKTIETYADGTTKTLKPKVTLEFD